MPWHRIAAPCEMMVNSSGLDGVPTARTGFRFACPGTRSGKGTRVDEGPVPGMKRAGVVLLLETAAVVHLEYQDERCWLAQFGISRRERKFVRGFCSYPCQTTVGQCPKFNIATKLCSPIGTQLVSS